MGQTLAKNLRRRGKIAKLSLCKVGPAGQFKNCIKLKKIILNLLLKFVWSLVSATALCRPLFIVNTPYHHACIPHSMP